MRHLPAAALIVIAAALAGCSADPGSRREIALLRSELVDLENQYYALRSRCAAAGVNLNDLPPLPGRMVDDSACDSGACDSGWDSTTSGGDRIGNETWIENSPSGSGQSGSSGPYFPNSTPSYPMETQRPASPGSQPPSLRVPDGTVEPEEIPVGDRRGGSPRSLNGPDGLGTSRGGTAAIPAGQNQGGLPSADSGQRTNATELVAIGEQTAPRDLDGDGTPDGIEAAFALLDAEGNAVPGPARLVFSLMDNSLPPGQQRIGLWEHTTDPGEPRRGSREHADPFNYPQKVVLPWKNGVPRGSTLWLFIRHNGAADAPLESSTPVTIQAGPPLDGNTTPRTAHSHGRGSDPRETGSISRDPAPDIQIELDGLDAGNRGRPRWRPNR